MTYHSFFWMCIFQIKTYGLKRDAVEDIAKSFGIDIVDIVLTGTLQEAIDFVKTKPKSHIGNSQYGRTCMQTCCRNA